jgi:hypothetical protein
MEKEKFAIAASCILTFEPKSCGIVVSLNNLEILSRFTPSQKLMPTVGIRR